MQRRVREAERALRAKRKRYYLYGVVGVARRFLLKGEREDWSLEIRSKESLPRYLILSGLNISLPARRIFHVTLRE